jgi:hypothetical protein
MEKLGGEEIGRRASIRQVAFASFIGTAIEWYDFFLYSGISFGYQMAGMLGGALAPIIATVLIQWAGGASWPVATYLAANSLVSLVAVYLATERYRVEIHDERGLAGERG